MGWPLHSQLHISWWRLPREDRCPVSGVLPRYISSHLITLTDCSFHAAHSSLLLLCMACQGPGKGSASGPCACAGLYFAIGVFLDLFLLGATTFAGVNYSTNAEAFQKAVKQVLALRSPHNHTLCMCELRKPGPLGLSMHGIYFVVLSQEPRTLPVHVLCAAY